MHQSTVTADKVDAAGLGRPVQGQGKGTQSSVSLAPATRAME